MNKLLSALAIAAIGLGLGSAPAPAHAATGLEKVRLGCYVDTFAYDQLVEGYCGALWYPGTANANTVAVFEVTGQLTGPTYSYSWSKTGCGNSPQCAVPIHAVPAQTIPMKVRVKNLNTGFYVDVTATAEYASGYN